MPQLNVPQVAGAAGGVGTSTIAAALRAGDCGICRGGSPVDVMVCRSTLYSVGCAQRAIGAAPRPPLLAVVADTLSGLGSNTKSRLRMTEPYVQGIVVVPFVHEWRDTDLPYDQARDVLAVEGAKHLRAFTDAVEQLVEHLLSACERAASTREPVSAFASLHRPPAYP